MAHSPPANSAPHYHAWTVAAAAAEWRNDSGTGYEESVSHSISRRLSLEDEHSHMSMAQVLEDQTDGGEVKITSWQAGLILFKSSIGVALLGMPFAFKMSGLITGQLFIVLNAFITNFTTKLLVKSKRYLQETRHKGISSLPDMAYSLWGPVGLFGTNIILIICQVGNCIAYGIFLSVSSTAIMKEIHPSIGQEMYSYDSPYILATVAWTVLFIMLVQIQQMSKLAPFLFLAQGAMGVALFLIIAYGLTHPSVCDKDGVVGYFCKVHNTIRMDTFPVFVGIAVFALEGVPTVLLVENSMANPADFDFVVDRAMTCVTLVMLVFGTLGYWLYGASTQSVISLNTQGTWGVLVKVLLCLVISLSYPLQFLPVAQILEMLAESDLFGRLYVKMPSGLHETGWLGRSREDFMNKSKHYLKICAVILGSIMTIMFPHFGHTLSILGSVLFSWVVYMAPPLMYMSARRGEVSWKMTAICVAVVTFGVIIMCVGLWSNIWGQAAPTHHGHDMTIEQAPPKPDSTAVKSAQRIFKGAAGMTKSGKEYLVHTEKKDLGHHGERESSKKHFLQPDQIEVPVIDQPPSEFPSSAAEHAKKGGVGGGYTAPQPPTPPHSSGAAHSAHTQHAHDQGTISYTSGRADDAGGGGGVAQAHHGGGHVFHKMGPHPYIKGPTHYEAPDHSTRPHSPSSTIWVPEDMESFCRAGRESFVWELYRSEAWAHMTMFNFNDAYKCFRAGAWVDPLNSKAWLDWADFLQYQQQADASGRVLAKILVPDIETVESILTQGLEKIPGQPDLQAKLEKVRAAGDSSDNRRTHDEAAKLAGQALRHLQINGEEQSVMPSMRRCALPGCAVRMESCKLRMCSLCRLVRYCGAEHQREHWKVHKRSCVPKS